jgi:hypothetical protein
MQQHNSRVTAYLQDNTLLSYAYSEIFVVAKTILSLLTAIPMQRAKTKKEEV